MSVICHRCEPDWPVRDNVPTCDACGEEVWGLVWVWFWSQVAMALVLEAFMVREGEHIDPPIDRADFLRSFDGCGL